LKLNELLASHQGASNRMVDIEDLTEDELDQFHKFYVYLSDLAEKEEDITCTHSIDAANELHLLKLGTYQTRKSYINAKKNKSKQSK
jgi:low affinity Fe/Cu permease